jgi:hypothetical protein
VAKSARDVDPVALAVQCRYLEHWVDIGSNEEQVVLIDWISTALAQLAGVDVRHDPSIRTES